MKTILTFLITFVLIINTNVIYSQYSEQEKADLLFTLQEEKVAYDFYTEMYNKYNQKVFGNIMEAEKTHQQHVLSILNSLNIDAGGVGSVRRVNFRIRKLLISIKCFLRLEAILSLTL
jgi:hypothetical protein